MTEYYRRGTSEVHFLPAISTVTAPTAAERGAGTDLSASVSEMSGWEFDNAPIATPKLSTTFTTTITGPDEAGNPQIEFYDDDSSTTIRDALAKGTTGFIVLSAIGATTSSRCQVFPVKTVGVNDDWTLAAEAAKFTVGFAVTSEPTLTGATWAA